MDTCDPSLTSGAHPLIFLISEAVKSKLETKHQIKPEMIQGCFQNWRDRHLLEQREQHKTEPATRWFIASVASQRWPLKICFVYLAEKHAIAIKTAYPANPKERHIYRKYMSAKNIQEITTEFWR